MKDVYMANLMRNNNGSENSLDDCPIVIRFRKESSSLSDSGKNYHVEESKRGSADPI